ncbi:MAG: hypothetical protein ACHQLA_06245 [Ignavibacteriales bacterium]
MKIEFNYLYLFKITILNKIYGVVLIELSASEKFFIKTDCIILALIAVVVTTQTNSCAAFFINFSGIIGYTTFS